MMGEPRMVWSSPALIALERRRPEESVLTVCKTYQAGGADPGVQNASCMLALQCDYCSAPVGS